MPGFFGYVREPILLNGKIIQTNDPILNETYLIMIVVAVMILFFAILYDNFFSEFKSEIFLFNKEIKESIYIPLVLFIISFITVLFTFYQMGDSLFKSKGNAWGELGVLHIFWRVSVSLLFVISVINKKKILLFYSFVLLILFFLMGSRSVIALSILAVILYKFNKKGKNPLFRIVKLLPLLLITIFGLTMFIGKRIYGGFQTNRLTGVFEALFNKDIYLESIVTSEPFSTQMILNTVVKFDYYIGIEHLRDLPLQLMIVPSFFGADSAGFSNTFKDTFYGFVNYGLAYNIWAEAYAVGKWPVLIIVILIYCMVLLLLNTLMKVKDKYIKSLVLIMGVYWAFYIHRNSMETIITYERYNFIFYVVSLIISFCIYIVLKRKSRT